MLLVSHILMKTRLNCKGLIAWKRIKDQQHNLPSWQGAHNEFTGDIKESELALASTRGTETRLMVSSVAW